MTQSLRNRVISKYEWNMLEVILRDSKLIKNPEYTARVFNIELPRLLTVIAEYDASGCLIIQSRMNYNAKKIYKDESRSKSKNSQSLSGR